MCLQGTKHHPSSVDLELIKRLAAASTYTTLTSFLCREFDCISKDLAGRTLACAGPCWPGMPLLSLSGIVTPWPPGSLA